MRRISRVNRSIDLLHTKTAPSQSSNVCLACRVQANCFSTSSSRPQPAATSERKASWTDKIGSKLWKKDESPSQDPYGSKSQLDRSTEGDEGQQRRGRWARDRPHHKPAKNWDGLQIVGDMRGITLPQGLEFEPFATKELVEDSATLIAALHRAVVEVFTLKHADKSYSAISDKPASVFDKTENVKITPTENGATLEYGPEGSAEDIVNELETPSSSIPTELVAKAEEVEQQEVSEEDAIAESTLTEPIVVEEKLTTRDIIRSFDKAWLEVPLQDLDTKFAASSLCPWILQYTNCLRLSNESFN
jgi:hypothetical protein